MRFLIGLVFILIAAVTLSLAVANDGYVLIVQPPYRMELSLNLLAVLLIVGFFVLHGALRLMQYTLTLPQRVRRYKLEQKRKTAHAALVEGIHALVEGRYAKAEKAAGQALTLEEDAGLSALVAARAAHKMKQPAKRDYYLAEAERLAPQAALARLLTQAELALDDRDYTATLATLQQLEKIEPHHLPAMRLRLKAHQRLGQWEQVLAMLEQLEKRDGLEPLYLAQLRVHAQAQLVERLRDNSAELLAYWRKLPEVQRVDHALARTAVRALIAAGQGAEAARSVEMSLTHEWDSALAALYGDCAGDTVAQLQEAEAWLHDHSDDAALLLSLGNLCLRSELWGKAQSYLEASLGMQGGSAAHLALARLLERLGQNEEAYRHYRLSLEYALNL